METEHHGIRTRIVGLMMLLAPAWALAHPTVELRLDTADLARLRSLAPEARTDVSLRDTAKAMTEAWSLRRIEVYAEDATVWVATAKGLEPSPRSPLQHYIGVRAGERIALSLMPDGTQGSGLLITGEGSFQLDATVSRDGLSLIGKSLDAPLPDGRLPEADCMGGLDATPVLHKALSLPAPIPAATPKAAARYLTLAIDTDNELMQQKFSNNASAATNYLVALVAAMNVIYEKEPGDGGARLQLQQGHTILRPSTTTDPYPSATGSSISEQLNEFGAYWMGNYGAVSRAFALMISGKSAVSNSAGGIAWILTSGSYCAATGMVWGGQTSGHYSVSRVFKFAGSNASHDAQLVAHELGHNFGLAHTHCTANSGTFPASASTLDRCVSGETMGSNPGDACYSGAVACPAGTSGTLMSYCHVSSAGCGGNQPLFHSVQVGTLNSRIGTQPSSCVVPIAPPNLPPSISAPAMLPVFVAGTAPVSGVSFSDPDAGSGSLTVTLTPPAGVTLSSNACTGISASGSSPRTFQGTLANLNTCFAAGNARMSGAGFVGPANMTITINDNGHTGTGGAKSASVTVQLRGGFLFANGFE